MIIPLITNVIQMLRKKCKLFPQQSQALSDSLKQIYWCDIKKIIAKYVCHSNHLSPDNVLKI